MEYVTLNNKLECPVVGIGTFMLSPADAENSVREALKMGYRLIDTANAYVNERAVGRGMKDSGVKREEIFLSTKLWPSEYENPNAVDETLERLGVDYVDLLYIHQPAGNWLEGYRQLDFFSSLYQSIFFLYSAPQFSIDLMIGLMDSPSSLNAYSTRGGTSGYTVRVMMPSASMERKLSVSTF